MRYLYHERGDLMKYSFTLIKYGHEVKFCDITQDAYNKTIDEVKNIEGSKLIHEWTTEYKESILYAKEYRYKSNILILWKEVIKMENKEELNETFENDCMIKQAKNSYISKEDLIKLIESLNFTEVTDFSMFCITSYKIKKNEHGNKYVDKLGFDIKIDRY